MILIQGGAKVVRITPTTFYQIFVNFLLLWVYVLCRDFLGRCFVNKKVLKHCLKFCLLMGDFGGERILLELPNTSTAPLLYIASYMHIV